MRIHYTHTTMNTLNQITKLSKTINWHTLNKESDSKYTSYSKVVDQITESVFYDTGLRYHASPVKLEIGDYLKPMGHKKLLYATKCPNLAVLFAGNAQDTKTKEIYTWGDQHFALGSICECKCKCSPECFDNMHWHIIENKKGMVDKFFKEKKCYLYEIDSDGFASVKSGLIDFEFVSVKKKQIKRRIDISDIWKYINNRIEGLIIKLHGKIPYVVKNNKRELNL